MKQRILVTGSRGLIGRNLCQALRAADVEVIEFDLAIPPGQPGHGDIRDVDACVKAISQAHGVFHLAAVSRVVWGEQNPALCHAVNVEGTSNVIAACKRMHNPPWLVATSSREVYGQQSLLPVAEYATLQPLNVYARSKVCGELALEAAAQRGLRAGHIRLSSVYGDTQDHSTRVVPAFILAALRAEPLRVDDNTGMLDLTHVNDVVAGLIAFSKNIASGSLSSPMHLVSGQGTTLLELATMVTGLTNSLSQIQTAAPRTYDVSRFVGDPHKALSTLGWKQRTPLVLGIKKLIAEYERDFAKNDSVTFEHPPFPEIGYTLSRPALPLI